MELLACPQCGSQWFVSSRSGERTVFQMDGQHQPVIAQPESISEDTVPINPDQIFCGACSWKGPENDLVESR
ncbi:hypothetical protein JWJ90_13915 [Desulfobulbus rhabdoformis]|uniref:hypothetical protein n=1 Tax=Desulfobulbus rhabdoformis TaxID=34032 RepID=UPI001962D416|nr:hypothetical protein [Desulfobulbus rhabdoformis]MBM9615376.1 hypothetical protein [Desulfobulbus rhabdoformis]